MEITWASSFYEKLIFLNLKNSISQKVSDNSKLAYNLHPVYNQPPAVAYPPVPVVAPAPLPPVVAPAVVAYQYGVPVQQPVLSSTGDLILETVIYGIPFNCIGKPSGHYRDTQFIDIFHACVHGYQRKTYVCPVVGERTYFDEKTLK